MSTNEKLMDDKYAVRDEILNKISPSFCSAKWLQSTIYLWNGFTHSCHHPSAHKVDVEAIKINPKALHNTPIKFVARADMLAGIQTPECTYCWNIENGPGDHLSDRTYKSASNWALGSTSAVLESGLGENINPTYLEVAFENTCNFKCTYCSSDVSSKWTEEIQRHGPYKLSNSTAHDISWLKVTGRTPIRHDEYNPYVEAFWKWWPELIQTLQVFRITGGEPLLSKHTWRVFDYLIENPRPDLELAVNTNLGVPKKLIDKLISYSKKLEGKVKSFDIYTSLEATGKQAEYIRYGMDYEQFIKNVRHILSSTHNSQRVHFMVATNILSVTTFTDFLQQIYNLRAEFNENDAENRIPMMISYVRWPTYLDIRNLSPDLKTKYAAEWSEFTKTRMRDTSQDRAARFYLEEIDQIERLSVFMCSDFNNVTNRKDFYLYHEEYDKRRNVDFAETFPELIPFLQECKSHVK